MATWILLRGLTREGAHWGGFISDFEAAVPGARVLTLDLPGNGPLHQEPSPSDVPAMVEQCRSDLQRLGISPPWHLLAMSLGGMVSVAWAQAHPEEVAAQVLVNTSLRPFSRFWQRLRPANYLALARLILPGSTPEDWERAVLRLTSNGMHEDVLPKWLALHHAHPVTRSNALRQLIAAARYQAPRRAPAPTLVLASERDRLVSCACSRALAAAWQCELQLHPQAGHDLALDDAPWLAARAARWMAGGGV
jgi:pimeloyl-ACP methyl ester carboxylesterase